ncbi:ABC transporter ATP-binding protein [Cellulomonas citrea]|uniref:ABC transporter ATP-binding protein n=1 Tax=Cellulomonas citrea TaxID=1909423 RepID=UPI00135C96C4|nr:ABC transporter ATP-binding protein [Cellulomonas citrea]
MPTPAALEVTGLVKTYGSRRAVDGLDLTAHHGRLTAVLGPNGAGKTSTIECCEGLRSPDGGTVRVLGLAPDDHRLRSRVGVMLQDGGLPTAARAGDVLAHVAAMYARPRDVRELRDRLGLDAFARTTVRRLSGGQRQRLALACALVGNPELVFLDEPGAGLDPQARAAVWGLVRELRDRGVAVVLTTHQMDEAQALADDVVVVDHGTVVARGSVGELLTAARHTTTRLRTREPAPLEAVRRVLRPGLDVQVEPDGVLTLTGDLTPHDVHAITGALAEEGVLVADLTVGVRTLQDVFLELTGTELR